jgi:hypothetical protein
MEALSLESRIRNGGAVKAVVVLRDGSLVTEREIIEFWVTMYLTQYVC